MLLELRIENLLVIERAELRFGPGLNAITGETGAGKTVLAHSLDLLMGGRARPHVVRPGASEAYVEGAFELPEGLFDDPELEHLADRLPPQAGEIVLGRRVGTSGRTSAFIDGRSASAAELKALGTRLLAFYGQHEHRKLTLGAAQAEVLDRFAGEELLELRSRYRATHTEVRALARELEELNERVGMRARDLDLLRYELDEIEGAALLPDEDRELERERTRLRHAERLREAAAAARAAIAGNDDDVGGVLALLAEAEGALASVAGVEERLDDAASRIAGLVVEAGDISSELLGSLEAAESDPQQLQAAEERLELIDRLKRKHGGSVEAVAAHAEACREQILELSGAEERSDELAAQLEAAAERRRELGEELTKLRKAAVTPFTKQVEAELTQLAMEGASVEVVLEPHPDGFGPSGMEAVELLVATNAGMPAGSLREAASGGELSRLMLALIGQGAASSSQTIVFDEIDAGVGGGTAKAVGERLRALAGDASGQVLCITHLPQVAALADTHFRVVKRAAGDSTVAEVERVHGEELVAEIRRMLGGDKSDKAATRHARELLKAA
jgi:DNA repair protein RecN (Recombination protein N)